MSEKKYYIQTYGCQANIRDSQNMAGSLDALGFLPTSDYKGADVIIINTCSVRQKSEDKVYGWGLKLGDGYDARENLYDKKSSQIVFVTGCMVGSVKGDRSRYSEDDLYERLPWANYLLAPHEEYRIPSILVKEGLVDEWALETLKGFGDNEIDPNAENGTEWAYVNISTGCDNFCTFCVVPYARGKEISRSKEDILGEVKHLSSRGYKNIMLVGQNVNSWGLDRKTKFQLRAGSKHKIPFASLLRAVHEISKVEKISFMSSNPFDFTRDLIETLALPKIDKYLHMAVQSGNNEILQRMNRRHTIEEFMQLVQDIQKVVPDMRFGTDIIVGFPGETGDQFEDTVKLFQQIKFRVAFISIYSAREGTNAAKFMKDDVARREKRRRHARLTEIWNQSLQ